MRNLELGYGSNVTTLVRVAHALDADDWLTALTPVPQFDPFEVLEASRRTHPSAPRVRRARRGPAAGAG